MGKRTKVGKQRKDKFYKLAKETGYRSRASFKLIQLNRKFEFLQKSRILIDLCAAPGGWLQVAHKSMPVSSLIIGVDLVSIRPIPNVITLQEDITTDRCKQSIKKQLKTWKADVVLHDGAPNVGKSWIHDAFAQVQLTLSALKLATELLMPNGWFVTKVFRSKDYNNLLWVFQKLFRKVHVTKPQASRNESAEIFVVCQGYLAPDRIDPRFLDSSSLFKDVEDKSEKKNLLQPSKKKPKAEGYDDGEESVFYKLKASDFILGDNHLDLLAKSSKIIFDDPDIADHRLTTPEIKEHCQDIKVLGKGELRTLLNWRKALRAAIEDQEKSKKETESVDETNDEKTVEELEIEDAVKEAEGIEFEKYQELKRKKKKVQKEKRKINEKINLKMIIKDNDPIVEVEQELFSLNILKNKKDLSKLDLHEDMDLEGESENDEQDNELPVKLHKSNFTTYNRFEDHEAWDVPNTTKSEETDSDDDEKELEFDELEKGDSEDEENNVESDNEEDNPLLVHLSEKNERVQDTVNKWFDKDDFAEVLENEDDDNLEMELIAENMQKQHSTSSKTKPDLNSQGTLISVDHSNEDKSNDILYDNDNDSNADNESYGILNGTKGEKSNPPMEIEANKKLKKKKKRVMLTPEELALGTIMIQSKKAKRDILDFAYNRYANNDENLPDWFVKDEEKHNRKQLPVTAEMVKEYKEQLKAINARPIKKVIEAKARKKKKVLRQMEKARKKAEALTDNMDMSEKEKSEQIQSIYKKAMRNKDENVTYVVAKKGVGKRVHRPTGVKGRFKVVDSRMKKDDRKRKMNLKSKRKGHKMKSNKRKGRR